MQWSRGRETCRGFFVKREGENRVGGGGSPVLEMIEPRPLHCGWPLFEPVRRFEMGSILDCPADDLAEFAVRQALGHKSSGWWACELADNSLTWTAGVYEIFGFPQSARVTRDESVALYCEDSRAQMERLRSHAIRQATGFVLDAQIRPANGEEVRWMRLIGATIVEDGRPIRLQGLKLRI